MTLGGDMEVVRLGYGAMRITGKGVWGHPKDPDAARQLLRQVVYAGVNLIDTSDAYGPEVSEYLIAEALTPYPDGLVIATKGGLTRGGPGDWQVDGRPAQLERACANSLRRLRQARIDLYQLHAVDDAVPIEDSVGALAKLQKAGKIRHIGVSNVSIEQLERARKEAEIVSVQNRFNLVDRTHEDVLDYCEAHGIGFIPWFPLATGDLTRPDGPVSNVAKRLGAKPSQVALAWLLHRSPVMLPIPGTSSGDHFAQNQGGADLALGEADMAELNAAKSAKSGA